MELQDRRRDLRRHGAKEAVPDSLRLVRAAGDQQDPLGLHNGLHTHGVRLPGHLCLVFKEAGVCGDGALRQGHLMGAAGKAAVRLVEADVGVAADAQQLKIDAVMLLNDPVIPGALQSAVGLGAVRQEASVRRDIDMVKQILPHEAAVALGMVPGQAAVFVQVDGNRLPEIQLALLIPLNQMAVGADGGGAGGKAQHALGVQGHLRGDDVRSLQAHVIIIFRTNQSHRTSFTNFRFSGCISLTDNYRGRARSCQYGVHLPIRPFLRRFPLFPRLLTSSDLSAILIFSWWSFGIRRIEWEETC